MAGTLGCRTFDRAIGLAALAACGIAAAQPAVDEWRYTIAPGDTLIRLGATYLETPADWRGLQRLNRVVEPRRLVPGSALRMPLAWLKREATVAQALHVNGDVALLRGGASQPLQAGAALQAGDALAAGSGASATIRFADGSRLLVLPDSRLAIDRLLRYGASDVAETKLRLDGGGADVQVPHEPQRMRRFELNTPSVNLGVRGTEFRAHADAASKAARVEVLDGRVAAGEHAPLLIGAGFGALMEPGVAPRAVPLLGAPDLGALPARLERIPLRFVWPALDGARGYRAQVYADAEPPQLLLDGRFDAAAARWADLPDGRYRLSVRAIDGGGLEGRNAIAPFVLKARPQPPFTSRPALNAKVYGEHADFAWTKSSSAARYRLQVAATPDFAAPRLDSADLIEPQHRVALPPGDWHWRVASIAADGDAGPFGDAQAFTQRPIPASPQLEPPEVGDDALLLRWGAPAQGERVEYQLARDAAFAQAIDGGTTSEAQLALSKPEPGTYHLRVRTLDADGFAGPWGSTQQIDVPHSKGWLLLPALWLLFAL